MEPPSPGHDRSRNDDHTTGVAASNFGGWLAFLLLLAMLLKMCGN